MSKPRAIASLIDPLARAALGGKGSSIGALSAAWESVVGAAWSRRAIPDRLSFPTGRRDGGTLTLRVEPADAVLVQHDLPALLDRINGHFGYRAIERIRLVQAPTPAGSGGAPPVRRRLTPADAEAVAVAVEATDDPTLKASLLRLGRALFARQSGP